MEMGFSAYRKAPRIIERKWEDGGRVVGSANDRAEGRSASIDIRILFAVDVI